MNDSADPPTVAGKSAISGMSINSNSGWSGDTSLGASGSNGSPIATSGMSSAFAVVGANRNAKSNAVRGRAHVRMLGAGGKD